MIPTTLYVLAAFIMGSMSSLAGVAMGGFFVYRAFRKDPLIAHRVRGGAFTVDPFKDDEPKSKDSNMQKPSPYPEVMTPKLYGDFDATLPTVIHEAAKRANAMIDKTTEGVEK